MFEISSIPTFRKELKRLSKKYPSLLHDVRALANSLEQTPIQGDALGQGS